MQKLVGQSLDRYEILSLLGEGGMGAVLKAHDITLQRDVAIKVMHSHFARQPDFQERFLREARTAAGLDHEGIVRVHDFGQARSLLYIVMEFIPGDNLRQMLQGLKTTNQWIVLPEAIEIVRQVSLALDYAHQQGVLHRDIKPDNVMLKPKPTDALPYRPVITDLGLAKLREGGMLTQEGVSMGTPAYMSPEQALGKVTDARSDVYSLGIFLYELTVGQLPFRVKTITEAIRCHTKEPPPPPRSIRPDLPEPIERILLRTLEKDPADRFPDAKALAEALAGTLSEASVVATPPTVFAEAVSLMTRYQQSLVEARGPSILDEFPEPPADLSQDRVSIMARDRTMRSVSMKPHGLTIGRSADNDVVLDDPKVSRRHARVEFDGAHYKVTDLNSTNGTYLADVKLLPGVSEVWTPDKQLRIGDSWLRLERARQQQLAETPLFRSDETMVAPNLIRSSPGPGRVGVFMEMTQFSVEPGSSTTASVIVLNQGAVVDHLKASVEGVPADWVPAPAPVVRLMPGAQQEVTLTIQPPRSPQSRAGRYPLTIRVASQDAPDQVAEVAATLTVAAYHQFNLDLRPRKQSGTSEGTFRVQVSSQGNANLTVQMEAADPEEGCLYTFDPPRVVVPAGQECLVQLKVRPKVLLPGVMAKTFPFTVTARPAEAPGLIRQVQGEWEQVPPTFELTLRPQKQSGVAGGTFRVQVTNQGNADLMVQMEAVNPEEGCLYTFYPPQMVVPAGQERLVQLKVRPKAPLPGVMPRTFPFTVTARPAEAPRLTQQVQGEWEQVPPTFELTLRPQKQSGVAGGTFRVQVTNQSNADLTMQMEAMDPEEGCLYTFDPSQVVVPTGQERLVQLKVRPKAPLPGMMPRTFFLTVIARPAEAPGLTRQVQGEWEQVPPTFELTLHPQKQSRAAEGVFKVQVSNPGDADLTVQLVAMDPEGNCLYTFDPSQVVVPAGQERPVQLQVRSKAPLAGEETRVHTFTVIARPAEAPGLACQVQGEWEQIPRRLAKGVWWAILLTIIGWSIAWVSAIILGGTFTRIFMDAIGRALFGAIVRVASIDFAELIFFGVPSTIRGIIVGAVGGLITGLALRRARPAIRGKQVLVIAFGWIICWTVAETALASVVRMASRMTSLPLFWGMYGAIVGIAGGSITGRALRRAEPAVKPFVIAFSWAIAWASSEIIVFWLVRHGLLWLPIDRSFHFIGGVSVLLVRMAFVGLIAGVIGGGIMFWHLSRVRGKA